MGRGRKTARKFLKDNKDTMAKLDAEVRKALGLVQTAAHPQPAAASAQTPPQQSARVTTMPSAAPEPAKVPVAAKREVRSCGAGAPARVPATSNRSRARSARPHTHPPANHRSF